MKRSFSKLIIVFVLVGLSAPPLSGEEVKKKIVFFSPSVKSDVFWMNVSKVMQAACDSFGFDLAIYWAERDQYKMVEQMEESLKQKKKPDVFVFQSQKMNGPQMLKIAEREKIPALIFNAGLSDKLGQSQKYGLPREKLKYWIGQMLPDDQKAGYDVAITLIKMAQKKGLVDANGKIHMVGLEGTVSDGASIERKKGLMKAVNEEKDVILHQIVSASWDRKKGRVSFTNLKKLYKTIHVVWAANDPMALGVIDAMKRFHIEPGKDMLVGSIDWIPEALSAVQAGELAVSVGGHFMEGGWIVVLLNDYFNGVDFASESVDLRSSMGILTRQNINAYIDNFGQRQWEQIDFTKFSKKIHPDLDHYQFTLDEMIKALKKNES